MLNAFWLSEMKYYCVFFNHYVCLSLYFYMKMNENECVLKKVLSYIHEKILSAKPMLSGNEYTPTSMSGKI